MSTEIKEPAVVLPKNWRELVKKAASEKREVSVANEEIDSALKWLQKSRASYAQVLRPAKKGDAMDVNFEVSADGKILEGGEAKNHTVVFGEGGYIPGFEDALLGMEAGQEKTFSLDSKGSRLTFHVKVNSVKDRVLPDLNDAFAASLGKFETFEAFRSSVRDGLLEEKRQQERGRTRLLMVAMVDAAAKIDVPEVLVRDEVRTMMVELKSSVAAMGLSFEAYLQQIKKTLEELEKDFYPDAVRRVRYGLVLREIASELAVEPTSEEVEAEANKFLLRYKAPKEAENAIDVQNLFRYTRNVLRNEKTFESLEKIASSTGDEHV